MTMTTYVNYQTKQKYWSQIVMYIVVSVSGYVPTSPARGTSSTPVPNKIPKAPTDTPDRGPLLVKYVFVCFSGYKCY